MGFMRMGDPETAFKKMNEQLAAHGIRIEPHFYCMECGFMTRHMDELINHKRTCQ